MTGVQTCALPIFTQTELDTIVSKNPIVINDIDAETDGPIEIKGGLRGVTLRNFLETMKQMYNRLAHKYGTYEFGDHIFFEGISPDGLVRWRS